MLIGILLAQIRSPNIIRVCISYQSDRHIKVCISHQSDCRIRVRISHQSYHSNWKACTNHCVWVFFLLTNDVMESGVVHKGSHLTFFIIWKLKRVFSAPLLTTHTPNNWYSITYHETNVQSPIRTYPIIALNEHQAILHLLELYSINQIHFATLAFAPQCPTLLKKIHMELNANDSEFST